MEQKGLGSGGVASPSPWVMICDESAQTEDLVSLLEGRGITVARVAPALVAGSLEREPPSLLVCDAEALPSLQIKAGLAIPLVLLGTPSNESVVGEARAVLQRPIDPRAFVELIASLVRAQPASEGGTALRAEAAPAAPAQSARVISSGTAARADRAVGSDAPAASSGEAALSSQADRANHAEMSPELVQLLQQSEEAVRQLARNQREAGPAAVKLGETELLPDELLELLDEPLDPLQTEPADVRRLDQSVPPPAAAVPAANERDEPTRPGDEEAETEAPPAQKTRTSVGPVTREEAITALGKPSRPAESGRPLLDDETRPGGFVAQGEAASKSPARDEQRLLSEKLSRGPAQQGAPTPAFGYVAAAIAERFSGALAFQASDGVRRVVLHEGDFVSAGSGSHDESLLAFLAAEDAIDASEFEELSHRVPPFGRHAGAALIAEGMMGPDELWTVLRLHAEWLLRRILFGASDAGVRENIVPERMAKEPAVFGGATGARVFVDLARQHLDPEHAERALRRVQRLERGAHAQLLKECALLPDEQTALTRVLDATWDASLERAYGAVWLALDALGVIQCVAASAHPAGSDSAPSSRPERVRPVPPALGRERIQEQKAVIDDGDYFSVLGVSEDASGQEIRAAFLRLRKEFQPSRALAAANVDLAGELAEIVEVIEEAYSILRDPNVRERYREALRPAR